MGRRAEKSTITILPENENEYLIFQEFNIIQIFKDVCIKNA